MLFRRQVQEGHLCLFLAAVLCLLVIGCAGSGGVGMEEPSSLADPVAQLRGVVVDQATRQALSGVTVQLIDATDQARESLTDAEGVFEFANLPPQQAFTLRLDVNGYEGIHQAIDPIGEGQTFKLNLQLVAVVQALPAGDGLVLNLSAPNFSLKDADGVIHSLTDYAGQKVVLQFYRGNW